MKSDRTRKKVDASLIILVILVLIIAAIAFGTGGWPRIVSGLKQSRHLVDKVWLRLLLGFVLGGLIHVLVPHELIAKWLGPTSGMKGILIGSYIGMFLTGAPFVRMPIIASIYHAGAGPGPVIALLASNGLSLQSLIVWQIPFLGAGISLARFAAGFFIPPIAGLAGAAVYRLLSFSSPKETSQSDAEIKPRADIQGKPYPVSTKEEK